MRRLTCNGTCWSVSYVIGTTPGRYHAIDGEANVSNRADMTEVRHLDIRFLIVMGWGKGCDSARCLIALLSHARRLIDVLSLR